ncbi:hypothetical protein [Flavobacterium polysaccharolyticum]|uniref:Lipoprotein n=1 Tax=Flavobacterium polysaccharolyticum TaxID=3133148 RepID=A0ABU9NK69_9FLAO
MRQTDVVSKFKIVNVTTMRNLILLAPFFIFFACKKEQLPEQLSRDNQLEIYTYGAPWSDQFQASFNQTETSKDTLYVAKFEIVNGEKKQSLKKIKLKPNEIDSLYLYFQKIKDNFELKDMKTRVMDGTSVGISIRNNTTSLSYSYRGLDKAENSTMEIRKLLIFINSRLPKDFQMY